MNWTEYIYYKQDQHVQGSFQAAVCTYRSHNRRTFIFTDELELCQPLSSCSRFCCPCTRCSPDAADRGIAVRQGCSEGQEAANSINTWQTAAFWHARWKHSPLNRVNSQIRVGSARALPQACVHPLVIKDVSKPCWYRWLGPWFHGNPFVFCKAFTATQGPGLSFCTSIPHLPISLPSSTD